MISDIVIKRLESYDCSTNQKCKLALSEIIQEIILLGLWRGKFFERAAFYGGTALRILYGLNRFSEDLDFSLLEKDSSFSLDNYSTCIQESLSSLGFEIEIKEKKKAPDKLIKSAFIKANTKEHLLKVGVFHPGIKNVNKNDIMKIKFEVDSHPPMGFKTEVKVHNFPLLFPVKCFSKEDLFAGKIHALLFRNYTNWVKGRDWYDFLWFIANKIPVHLHHLRQRMIDSDHYNPRKELSSEEVKILIAEKIESLNIASAKEDIVNFIENDWEIDMWSKDFFLKSVDLITFI